MKHSNYLLPNFINVIYKKVEHNLRASNIDRTRFYQYCLAVLLFYLKQYREDIVGLPFSEKDEATFNHLCTACQFGPGEEDEGEEGKILTGLCPDLFGDFGVVSSIQLLVNYFSRYQVLKDYDDQSPLLERDYSDACIKLETLRKEFRLPARFKYNKFKRKDNPFFKGGVEVVIPDEATPEPTASTQEDAVVHPDTSTEESI